MEEAQKLGRSSKAWKKLENLKEARKLDRSSKETREKLRGSLEETRKKLGKFPKVLISLFQASTY
jgi:hypothetical protein